MIAYNMLEYRQFRGITEGATHYHATYVNPRWAKDLQMIGRLGAHIFIGGNNKCLIKRQLKYSIRILI